MYLFKRSFTEESGRFPFQGVIYNPQIHPFVFSKRNVRLWRGVPKTKRSIFEKIQMPFKQLSKSL